MNHDSFCADVICPKCKVVNRIIFETDAIGGQFKKYFIGDKLLPKNLLINYGEILNVVGTCDKCGVYLKGTIEIVASKFYKMKGVCICGISV